MADGDDIERLGALSFGGHKFPLCHVVPCHVGALPSQGSGSMSHE
jgi:hypothetical protein